MTHMAPDILTSDNTDADMSDIAARRFCIQSVGMLLLFLTGVAAFTLQVDPYWLWKSYPEWDRNVALGRKMRFGKPLQAVTRQPDVIFLGTSRVMRGLDPELVADDSHTYYNFGINSLRMPEAVAYIKHLTKYTKTKQIVFGLDYIMFDGSVDSKPGFDPSTGTHDFVVNGFCTALISKDALTDAWTLYTQKPNPSKRTWSFSGLKQQNPMTSQKIDSKLKTMGFRQSVLSVSRFELLENIIEHCKQHDIELMLFFSPAHERVLNAYEESGHWDNYLMVKERVQQIAAAHHVKIWDFGTYNGVTTVPLHASNEYYFDTSHYTPKVGAEILRKLGYPIKPTNDTLLQTTTNFGQQLNRHVMLSTRRKAQRN